VACCCRSVFCCQLVSDNLERNISHFFNTDYTFHLPQVLFTYRRQKYDYNYRCHYFKMNMNNLDDLIQRYLNNTASDEERATLMAMIRSGQYEDDIKDMISEELRAELLHNQTPDLVAQAKSEVIFKKILDARTPESEKMWIDRNDQPPTKFKNAWRFIGYAAASLLLLATAGILLYTQRSQPQTETAFEKQPDTSWVKIFNGQTHVEKITLEDGSIISLEPGSEIQYPEKFGDKREICLTGEAFFEIKKDAAHPFLVYTNEVTTKVLGTSFRIKAHQQSKEIIVAVTTGKVSVFAKPDASAEKIQEVTLTPNLQAVYDRMQQSVVKKIVEHPSIIKPPSSKNYYTNVKVINLLSALSESYGVEIKYSEVMLANCTLTTDIMDEEGLYDQLEVICNALGARYAMEGATIVIESNGCEKSNVKP
jgi:transmembrane sensor